MKKALIIAIVFLLLLNVFQFIWHNTAHRLFTDIVANEQTALEIGRAVLVALYGEEIRAEPLEVNYNSNKKQWRVAAISTKDMVGGPAAVYIRQHDGKVMSIYNGM